jgi:hypothetical protein
LELGLVLQWEKELSDWASFHLVAKNYRNLRAVTPGRKIRECKTWQARCYRMPKEVENGKENLAFVKNI